MTDQKKKRVFSACLAGGIMLTFILLSVLVYQVVGIFLRRKQIEFLDAEIIRLEREIKETENEIESWGLDWIIEQRARELGLHYEKED